MIQTLAVHAYLCCTLKQFLLEPGLSPHHTKPLHPKIPFSIITYICDASAECNSLSSNEVITDR